MVWRFRRVTEILKYKIQTGVKGLNVKNNKTKAFLESLLIIVLGTLYILLGIRYIPIINILYPAFFVILGVRNGIEYNIVSILISALLVGVFIEKYTCLFILIAFVPFSILLNYMIKKRKKANETIMVSTITLLICYVLALTILSKMAGVTFINELEKSLQLILKAQLDLLKDMGTSSYQMYETKGLLESIYEYMVLIVPSIIIMFSAITAYLNSLLSIVILRKLGYGIYQVPKISNFKLPSNVILGIAVIYGGVFLLKFLKLFYYETIFMNVSVLVSFVLFLQGISVIIYFLNRSRLHPIIRGIFIILLIVSVPLSAIISIVGFLDIIFNFRRINKGI